MAGKLIQERRNEIAQRLVQDGKVSALALAGIYGVSTETIRKDLLWLEAQGVAQKGYGGAIVASPIFEKTFFEKSTHALAEKRRIAKAAVGKIPTGAVVILDSGSTTLEVARKLAANKGITFFTNSLQAAQLLSEKKCNIHMLGGSIRQSSQAATGLWTVAQLEQIRADYAILGTSGFMGSDGPCVENPEEAQVKRAMIRAARHSMVVADSSKIQCSATFRFAAWKDILALISDNGLDAASEKTLAQWVDIEIV